MNNQEPNNTSAPLHKKSLVYQYLRDIVKDAVDERIQETEQRLTSKVRKRQEEVIDKLADVVWRQQEEAIHKLTSEVWKQQKDAVDKLTREIWKQQGEAVDKLIGEIWKQQREAVDKLIDEIWKQQREALLQIEAQRQSDRNRLVKLTPRNICRFQTHIVEHCNLNCASCAHYSPLHDKEFLCVEEYKKDYKRLSALFSGEAELIEILGGEPLLHPEITAFMEIARDCFPHAPIHILTNGLLLPKMPEKFWQAMKSYVITLRITRYPVKFDYDGWAQRVEAMGIQVWLADEEVTWVAHKLDVSGGIPNGEAAARNLENFLNCYDSNFCVALEHGRLYTCPQAAYAKTFANYFDAPIDITDRDSINIHAAQSAEEITSFLARPIPFCRYCRVKERHVIPWGPSRKEIGEWS